MNRLGTTNTGGDRICRQQFHGSNKRSTQQIEKKMIFSHFALRFETRTYSA